MAPPKSKTGSPEPAIAETPSHSRVTRSSSRLANQGAARGSSAGASNPPTRGNSPSKEAAETPHLRARTSNTYGGAENTGLAIKKALYDDAGDTIDSVSATVSEALVRRKPTTRQSQPPSPASSYNLRSASRAPSDAESEDSAGPGSRGNVRRRRTRKSLDTISETSELASAFASAFSTSHARDATSNVQDGAINVQDATSKLQDTSLLDGNDATGLNTPYGELATSSENNSAAQSKPITPASTRSQPAHSVPSTTGNAATLFARASHVPHLVARTVASYVPMSWSSFVQFMLVLFTLATVHFVINSGVSWNSGFVRSVQSYAGAIVPSVPTLSKSQVLKLEKRIQGLETKVEQIMGMVSNLETRVEKIENELPERLVVRVVDGNLTITDEFWLALKSRLVDEHGTASESPWSHFLRSQKVKTSEMTRGPDNGRADTTFNAWLQKHDVITRDEFVRLVHEQIQLVQQAVDKQMDKKINAMELSVSTKVMDASSNLIKNSLATRTELENLPYILTHLARNYNLKMHIKNYFGVDMGASIDPYMSSPTAEPKMKLARRIYWKYIRKIWVNPQSTAIDEWSQPKQCWCTSDQAHLENGPRAQLAVQLARSVYPRSITVEHMPSGGIIDWRATPKNMELWVSIPDADQREAISRHSNAIFWDAADRERPGNGHARYDLDPSYVLLHSWMFDAHGMNHMQNFPMNVDVERHTVTINKAVVRATSNYGANHTCIYRVRLHGEDPASIAEAAEVGKPPKKGRSLFSPR